MFKVLTGCNIGCKLSTWKTSHFNKQFSKKMQRLDVQRRIRPADIAWPIVWLQWRSFFVLSLFINLFLTFSILIKKNNIRNNSKQQNCNFVSLVTISTCYQNQTVSSELHPVWKQNCYISRLGLQLILFLELLLNSLMSFTIWTTAKIYWAFRCE